MAIEYNIPQASKRIDFMISGYGQEYTPGIVIVELKQWEKIDEVKGMEALLKHSYRE